MGRFLEQGAGPMLTVDIGLMREGNVNREIISTGKDQCFDILKRLGPSSEFTSGKQPVLTSHQSEQPIQNQCIRAHRTDHLAAFDHRGSYQVITGKKLGTITDVHVRRH